MAAAEWEQYKDIEFRWGENILTKILLKMQNNNNVRAASARKSKGGKWGRCVTASRSTCQYRTGNENRPDTNGGLKR